LASEAAQLEPDDVGTAAPQSGAPISSYKLVSNAAAEKARTDELYSFRNAMEAAKPQPGSQPAKPPNRLLPILTIGAIAVALIAVAVLVFFSFPSLPKLSGQKPPALYIDLGNRRFDPAGLAGRLIVRWENKAAYELYLDPLDQADTAGFQSIAVNPKHPLSVVIRLLDAAGMVACQKEIDFPAPADPGSPFDATQLLVAKTTAGGDTIRDLTGSDGQVAEIDTSGPLPCPLNAYQRITAWEFAANFPTAPDQEIMAKQLAASARRSSRFGAGWRLSSLQLQHLPAPIEGDDVIVGDNPARETIDTSSGREFLVGGGVRSSEWQIFPSAIHFRCERTGICTLTRYSSHAILQARLVR